MPQILKPSTEQEFESLCSHVYGTVYRCKIPTMYGRRGQSQHGLDIIIHENDKVEESSRIGIQCKHVQKLTFDDKSGDSVCKEVKKADDEDAEQNIAKLVIVTSLASDKTLTDKVLELSDNRVKQGKFSVEIQFWNDIENIINQHQVLSERYYNNQSFEIYLKNAEELLNNQKYSSAIKEIEKIPRDLMNHPEQFKSLLILSSSYFVLKQVDKLTECMNDLATFDWDDATYQYLQVIAASYELNEDHLNQSLLQYPDNKQLKHLKNIYDIRNNRITNIDEVDEDFKDDYGVKIELLYTYIITNKFKEFNELFHTLDPADKYKPTSIFMQLQSQLFEFYNSNNTEDREKIKEALEQAQKVLSIENIEDHKVKVSFINQVISGYSAIEDLGEAKHWYKNAKRHNLTIDNYAINNFLILLHKQNDKGFFDEVFDDLFENFSEPLYFINSLYNFGDFEKIKSIISDNKLDIKIINELRSYLFIKNEIVTDDISDLLKHEDILSVNTLRGLYFVGMMLYKLKSDKFNDINCIIQETHHEPVDDLMSLSQFFYETNQFDLASEALEKLLDIEKQEYLILSYIQSLVICGKFSKAKDAVDKYLNEIYSKVPDFVDILCQLANITQDWSYVKKTLTKFKKFKNTSWYWRLKLAILYFDGDKKALRKALKKIPEELDTIPSNICFIAFHEVLNNREKSATARLINLWRSNPSDINILVSMQELFTEIMIKQGFKGNNPLFDLNTSHVTETCYVNIEIDNKEHGYFIDSKISNYDSSKFLNPNNDRLAESLLGKKVNDTIEYEAEFGRKISIKILEIKSLLLSIFHQNNESSTQPVNPFKMVSIQPDLDSEEGRDKFFEQIRQLSGSSNRVEEILTNYQASPITIALLAKSLNRDVTDICYNWLADCRHYIFTHDKRFTKDISISEIKSILDKNNKMVVDLFTLIELKKLNLFDLLDDIEVLIPQNCFNKLSLLAEEYNELIPEENLPKYMSIQHGNVSIQESSPIIFNQKSKDLKFILDYLEANAEVLPAYGSDTQTEIFKAINKLCPSEDIAVMRLCQEYNIPLLSFDARLRGLASQVDIMSIDVSDFLNIKLEKQDFINFQIRQFLDNRSFNTVQVYDLVNFAIKNQCIEEMILTYLRFFVYKFDLKKVFSQVDYLFGAFNVHGITVWNETAIRTYQIIFCLLTVNNELNFEEVKQKINEYCFTNYRLTPIKAKQIEDYNNINLDMYYIQYGVNQPVLRVKKL